MTTTSRETTVDDYWSDEAVEQRRKAAEAFGWASKPDRIAATRHGLIDGYFDVDRAVELAVWTCPRCAALVEDTETHQEWHERVER